MKHRKKKLIIQIMLIIIPLFAILAVVNIWIMEKSTVNAFLDSNNVYSTVNIEKMYSWLVDTTPTNEMEVYLSILEKDPTAARNELTEAEYNEYWNYYTAEDFPDSERYSYYYRILMDATDEMKVLFTKVWLSGRDLWLKDGVTYGNYSVAFLMDLTSPYTGMVISEYNKNGTSKDLGDYYDLNLSDHPALEQILKTRSEQVVFERTKDFPSEGNYYIAYKPIVIDGIPRMVIGLAYHWDDFKDQMSATRMIATFIILTGCLVASFLLYFGLRKLAVKPVTKIENALIQYTEDKDSKQIVKNMYDIKVKNEIGYLADIVSDLALEIDLYTKENVRLATEQARTEKELYEAEVQIMVSQIRPHFMYNTLSSIAMLCKLDPDTAYEATINFSDYLRCNMDSLKQTAPVPFTKELEHLKKYLYIEKLRFQDLLNIEYDIQTTDFFLPLLSIQPLVENAVKHGVGMKEDGGTVTIATRETEDAYEVIISDDGVGFDVNEKKDDGRSHVGMENTKKRLRDMCNADIIITSKVGEGTTARVIIPKNRKEDMET